MVEKDFDLSVWKKWEFSRSTWGHIIETTLPSLARRRFWSMVAVYFGFVRCEEDCYSMHFIKLQLWCIRGLALLIRKVDTPLISLRAIGLNKPSLIVYASWYVLNHVGIDGYSNSLKKKEWCIEMVQIRACRDLRDGKLEKLWLKNINKEAMYKFLKSLWYTKESVNFVSMMDRLFLVKFGSNEDRERIFNLSHCSFDQC
ncbi:hypothetical protein Goari_011460 [Gossypium aridum]|uniref:Uncharacterized protein n=1 Tax=Gossypium aridum TaxID=34290 RepID=A0A7J8WXD4_GOSAI|nr:hypothetical protein [Gossypium aridum]